MGTVTTMSEIRWLPLEGDYVVDEKGSTISVGGGRIAIEQMVREGYAFVTNVPLPADMALCRAVEPQALDMPDSPGHWAFEGVLDYGDEPLPEPEQTLWRVQETNLGLLAMSGMRMHKCKMLKGKWTRVYMPWESQVQATGDEMTP